MNITVVASRDTFERALRAASEPAVIESGRELATVLDGTFKGRLDSAWAAVESALREAFLYGRERAQTLMESAIERVEGLLNDAGARARELQDALLRRMHEFAWQYIEGAVGRMPRTLKVADGAFMLSTLRCTQKIVLGGSLKTNLGELFELAANGELELGAEYTLRLA